MTCVYVESSSSFTLHSGEHQDNNTLHGDYEHDKHDHVRQDFDDIDDDDGLRDDDYSDGCGYSGNGNDPDHVGGDDEDGCDDSADHGHDSGSRSDVECNDEVL